MEGEAASGKTHQPRSRQARRPRATLARITKRELRLALICYGGVSLAVYMHGITRELWNLTRASRAFADGGLPATPLGHVYADLFGALRDRAGVNLRVLPDILAGASAGGMNGLFLAQAIATGQSLEPLTTMWLEQADVERLLAPEARPASRLTKVWAEPIAWRLAKRGLGAADDLPNEVRAEIAVKLSHFVRARWFSPPFGGAILTTMILDALEAMAAGSSGPPLLPPRHPLDLFITATDFHGRPQRLALHSPPVVEEREHRVIFSFHTDRPGSLASAPALAFAARATASFPGAFPPMTVADFDAVLAERGSDWPTRDVDLAHLLPRRWADGTAEEAVLIDGSVLTNAPFGPALRALSSRPARRPVDRRFVYLDPDPGHSAVPRNISGDRSPGFFATVFGALSAIPREQPIRDNLEAIAARSARIGRLGRVVAALQPEVERQVDEAVGRPLFFNRPTGPRLMKWSRAVAARAIDDAGLSAVGYRELRVNQLCESLGEVFNADSAGALTEKLWDHLHGSPGATSDALDRLDTAYRSRRLRHLARTVDGLVAAEPSLTGQLEELRRVVFEALNALAEPTGEPRFAGPEPTAETLIAAVAAERELPEFDRRMADALALALSEVSDEPRRRLLRDWLGFAVLDLATLPLLQGEGLDEFEAIKVDRISPDDAQSLRGAGVPLRGVELNHFGAFFSRQYRENDYLLGRLNGAERMIDIVLSTVRVGERPPESWTAALKARAFAAILDEEEARLIHIGPLLARLRHFAGAGLASRDGAD